jgi:hypothetical protein
MKYSLLGCQRGQAMTEMLVASAFVLVPLFLIVPMLGKYIDMQHAAVAGARYVAWERTVKLPDSDRDDYQPSDYDKSATPYVSKLNLAAGMKNKLLSESGQLDASDNLGRKLWAYHDGTRILSDISVTDVDTGQSIHGVLAPVVGVFGDVLAGITTVLTLGSNTFDVINTNGVSNATVSMQTTSAPGFTSLSKDPEDKLIQTNALTFKASAQVYSLSWSAGGSDHLADKVTPLAPTAILSNHIEKATDTLKSYIPVPIPSSVTAQNIISVALLSPEIDDDELRFGHMDMSILPRDKYLEADRETKKYDDDINDLLNGDLCNSKGYCRDE